MAIQNCIVRIQGLDITQTTILRPKDQKGDFEFVLLYRGV
jgi:hypothetical protein